jgi:hypothetical protein
MIMSDCCGVNNQEKEIKEQNNNQDCCEVKGDTKNQESVETGCPICEANGKDVGMVTIKSMLLPEALGTLDAKQTYKFCTSNNCKVVYYGDQGAQFVTKDVKVAVFQKDPDQDVNACYCFGWTRAKIAEEFRSTGKSTAASSITGHIKAGRCGCEINNPQGSCCLGNVTATVKEAKQSLETVSSK